MSDQDQTGMIAEAVHAQQEQCVPQSDPHVAPEQDGVADDDEVCGPSSPCDAPASPDPSSSEADSGSDAADEDAVHADNNEALELGGADVPEPIAEPTGIDAPSSEKDGIDRADSGRLDKDLAGTAISADDKTGKSSSRDDGVGVEPGGTHLDSAATVSVGDASQNGGESSQNSKAADTMSQETIGSQTCTDEGEATQSQSSTASDAQSQPPPAPQDGSQPSAAKRRRVAPPAPPAVVVRVDPVTADTPWDYDAEHTSVQELVEWAPVPPDDIIVIDDDDDDDGGGGGGDDTDANNSWITVALRDTAVGSPQSGATESPYADAGIVARLYATKNALFISDPELELPGASLKTARSRANPFEAIGPAFFQNRAALKMANLDAVLDFNLSDPHDSRGEPLVDATRDLFYFADICAGPGGFTEYMLWRHPAGSAHGFGITLKGRDDFRLDDFLAASPEMFEAHYGVDPRGGSGDITRHDNMTAFVAFVLESTDFMGVHLVMADGGFAVDGAEQLQEVLSKRIYASQCAIALSILRPGGSFVCKLFDTLTPFSAGLIYLMYRCFDRLAIHKPNASRPANAERYLICRGFRVAASAPVRDHLFDVNHRFEQIVGSGAAERRPRRPPSARGGGRRGGRGGGGRSGDSESSAGSGGGNRPPVMDIESVVRPDVLARDSDFVQYIRRTNGRLAARQTLYLQKYRVFAADASRIDPRQAALRTAALAYWKVPDVPRRPPCRPSPDAELRRLLAENPMVAGGGIGEQSTPADDCDDLRWLSANPIPYPADCKLAADTDDGGVATELNLFEYVIIPTSARPFVLFSLGCGNHFAWEGSRWERLSSHALRLPLNTLLIAEIGVEWAGVAPNLTKSEYVHIIDAAFLGGVDISREHYLVRARRIAKFAKALSCRSLPELTPLRPPAAILPENLPLVRSRFRSRPVRGSPRVILHHTAAADGPFTTLYGLVFLKLVRPPWTVSFSRTQGRSFSFNRRTGASSFEPSADAAAPFVAAYTSRLFWSARGDPRRIFAERPLADVVRLDDIVAAIRVRLPGVIKATTAAVATSESSGSSDSQETTSATANGDGVLKSEPVEIGPMPRR